MLKVIARRCTIMGFDKPDGRTEPSRTVVIGGSHDEYIAGLKSVADAAALGRPG